MAVIAALESLQEAFRHMTDQMKSTQAAIQFLCKARKEADIKKHQSETLSSLKSMQETLTKVQMSIQTSQKNLEEALCRKPDNCEDPQQHHHHKAHFQQQQEPNDKEHQQHPEQKQPNQQENQHRSEQQNTNKKNLTLEAQSALCQLKTSRIQALGSQNKALKSELDLHKRREILLQNRHARNESYSGSRTLRAAHALEAKLRGAELKLKKLESDLQKSHQTARHYQELHDNSLHGSGGKSDVHEGQNHSQEWPRSRSAILPKPVPLPEQSFIGPSTTVNDVVRKNECLIEENSDQRREIERLKRDNAHLLLQAKSASTDKLSFVRHLSTSEAARLDLTKKYNKLKEQNLQLSQTMAKQTAGWLHTKKEQQNDEEKKRLSELGAVSPHGASERFREHKQKKNVHFPRQMFPVENYALTSAA